MTDSNDAGMDAVQRRLMFEDEWEIRFLFFDFDLGLVDLGLLYPKNSSSTNLIWSKTLEKA
jgi:hypothetical protein